MNRRYKLLLLAIILLAAFLRLYKLAEVPPGVNRDEASIGYTAYSLIQTGKDEYGKPFPLSFQSFGDWKLLLYIYTTIPFVKLFGLNEFAVRLPSAISGILTVLLTYFLLKELFPHKKGFSFQIWHLSFGIPEVATLLLALSPWHLHLSRVESESNVAVFLTVSAVLLFLKGLRGKPMLLALSLPLFALTYYTYHGNHIFTTLFLIGLCVIYHTRIPRRKPVIVSTLLSAALIAFILSQTLLGADKTKISGISIFGSPNVIHENIELPRTRSANPNGLITRLRYNRVTYAIVTITKNYINSFSPNFLFIKGGGNAAHNIKNFGNLYLVELPFFYAGIILLISSVFLKRSPLISHHSSLLLWWLLISPIAASITKDAPHTNRMFAIFPLPPILVALGIIWIMNALSKQKFFRSVIIISLCIAFLVNFALYMNRYYTHFPKQATNWGAGYKQLSELLNSEAYKNKQVIMTKPESSPYIFLLFYSGYDPSSYQKQAVRYPATEDAFVHVKGFDRFEFRDINWSADLGVSDTILIDETKDVPQWVRTSPQAFATIDQWTLVDTGPKLQ